MMTRSLSLSFARRDDGAVAMILALALIPIMLVAGFAMDMQRAQTLKIHVQAAADSAALAGAREFYDGSTNAKLVAESYFIQSMSTAAHGAQCDAPTVTTDDASAGVTVVANCHIDTTFGGLMGKDQIDIGSSSSASSKQTRLDLALMLDVSGSMSGQKIKDLKTAANTAVDILLAGATNETKIAITPYSTSVNLGNLTEAAVGSAQFDPNRANSTCVTERPGKAKKTAEAPGPGTYVGYETVSKNGNKSIWCPSAEVTPLSSNAADLKAQIDSLTTGGWTAGQLGIAWSWYAIAPEWASFWPAAAEPRPYETDTIKAVILMTDGSFNTTFDKDQGNSVNQSKGLCKQMRDSGVRVYSVAFKAPPGGKAVLEACASSADHYFEPEDGEELIAVYGEIASSLSNLRLTN